MVLLELLQSAGTVQEVPDVRYIRVVAAKEVSNEKNDAAITINGMNTVFARRKNPLEKMLSGLEAVFFMGRERNGK